MPVPAHLHRLCLLATFSLAACASKAPPPVYLDEAFAARSPFERKIAQSPEKTCEAGRRALLSQGYRVEAISLTSLKGTKFFQPEKNFHVELEISLVCLPESEHSVLYASARQMRYELKASNATAGVSVSGMGSISLPWAASGDSLAKVAEETVTDPEFYRRFFSLVDNTSN